MSRRFQKTAEDFTCEHCGQKVQGNGYTNHCPSCLWSKHVDVHPGDRSASCGGLMQPMRIEAHHGTFRIIHRCVICGLERPNKAAPGDALDTWQQD